jgi:Replication initiator protein A
MTMVDEAPADPLFRDDKNTTKSALLPQRHPNHDLFICDVLDAIPKDDMASMEHPIFSLATKADTRVLRYEHRNVVVEIAPSVRGLATIYDKDILIYCISQVMAKKNAGEPIAQTLHLNAHELLVWTNRETSGDGYPMLDPEAYHDARLVAPNYDVYFLEQEWRDWWVDSGMPELGFPGKAFVAFCRKRHQMKPNP